MYELVWRGEVIESDIETKEEAEYLQCEYAMAFRSSIQIRKQKV